MWVDELVGCRKAEDGEASAATWIRRRGGGELEGSDGRRFLPEEIRKREGGKEGRERETGRDGTRRQGEETEREGREGKRPAQGIVGYGKGEKEQTEKFREDSTRARGP